MMFICSDYYFSDQSYKINFKFITWVPVSFLGAQQTEPLHVADTLILGFSGYNTKRMDVDHSFQRVRRVSFFLYRKEPFCRFRKCVGPCATIVG